MIADHEVPTAGLATGIFVGIFAKANRPEDPATPWLWATAGIALLLFLSYIG